MGPLDKDSLCRLPGASLLAACQPKVLKPQSAAATLPVPSLTSQQAQGRPNDQCLGPVPEPLLKIVDELRPAYQQVASGLRLFVPVPEIPKSQQLRETRLCPSQTKEQMLAQALPKGKGGGESAPLILGMAFPTGEGPRSLNELRDELQLIKLTAGLFQSKKLKPEVYDEELGKFRLELNQFVRSVFDSNLPVEQGVQLLQSLLEIESIRPLVHVLFAYYGVSYGRHPISQQVIDPTLKNLGKKDLEKLIEGVLWGDSDFLNAFMRIGYSQLYQNNLAYEMARNLEFPQERIKKYEQWILSAERGEALSSLMNLVYRGNKSVQRIFNQIDPALFRERLEAERKQGAKDPQRLKNILGPLVHIATRENFLTDEQYARVVHEVARLHADLQTGKGQIHFPLEFRNWISQAATQLNQVERLGKWAQQSPYILNQIAWQAEHSPDSSIRAKAKEVLKTTDLSVYQGALSRWSEASPYSEEKDWLAYDGYHFELLALRSLAVAASYGNASAQSILRRELSPGSENFKNLAEKAARNSYSYAALVQLGELKDFKSAVMNACRQLDSEIPQSYRARKADPAFIVETLVLDAKRRPSGTAAKLLKLEPAYDFPHLLARFASEDPHLMGDPVMAEAAFALLDHQDCWAFDSRLAGTLIHLENLMFMNPYATDKFITRLEDPSFSVDPEVRKHLEDLTRIDLRGWLFQWRQGSLPREPIISMARRLAQLGNPYAQALVSDPRFEQEDFRPEAMIDLLNRKIVERECSLIEGFRDLDQRARQEFANLVYEHWLEALQNRSFPLTPYKVVGEFALNFFHQVTRTIQAGSNAKKIEEYLERVKSHRY